MSLEYLPTKKKILFVINTMGRAGAETALLAILKKLEKEYDISLYVLMGQGELLAQLPPSVHLLNPRYKTSSVLERSGSFDMYRTILGAMLRRGTIVRQLPGIFGALFSMMKKRRVLPDKLLWRVLSDGGLRFEEEYDLAVAFLEGGSAYYVADHVKAKKKAAFIHIDYTLAGYTRKLDHDCYLKFDRIFPVSDEVKECFLRAYPECAANTRVFHNIIDQQEIRHKAKLPGGFTDDFGGIRILTVGRLTRQKAYPVAIEAMRLLKESGAFVRWYVLGEGPERLNLERRIKEKGLTGDFLLLGAVENPYPYYAGTDIYVHATAFEGKSIAIQEAQTLGCAIVASDSSGNREQIISGTDGLLCRLDAVAVKDAVLSLVRNEALRERYGRAAAGRTMLYERELAMFYELLEKGA